ncbi:MAG TPA: hypothetical protein VND41_04950 [Nitrososphaerales archaeon]|nr:hypothetical protein [Nitrososphaerales archaeon]
MTPKKRSIVIVGAVVAVAALVLGAAFSGVWPASGASGKQTESLGIQGAVTLTVYGPAGQTLGVYKTHNSLVQPGISHVVLCLSDAASPSSGSAGGEAYCPGAGTTANPSLTASIGVGLNACIKAYSSCGVFSSATNTAIPSSCLQTACTGWTASASFSPTALGCATTCNLESVASGWAPFVSGATYQAQFDNITSFASTVYISAGDTLAVNIQFTVS